MTLQHQQPLCVTNDACLTWFVTYLQVEVLEYPELGMEAIWKIDVENFPAFIVVDCKGEDFFAKVLG